ncbi:MAG: long-chain fatty acid--CoA ligase [Treponemataceae bacterium]|nr:long-chain fatty acid--CoA ligase [Treponemataceae bacterium]
MFTPDPKRVDKTLAKTIPLVIKQRAQMYPNITAQAVKNTRSNSSNPGEFVRYSFSQVYADFCGLALALEELGIKRNDHVAIISDNRREWLLSDLAVLTLGGADVPRGTDSSGQEIRYIISCAECECGFFENPRQLAKVLDEVQEVPMLKTAILYEYSDEIAAEAEKAGIKAYEFQKIFERGQELYKVAGNKEKIEAEMDKTQESDLATIIFTSGTTGKPKGVMLTHRNYVAQLEVVHTVLDVKPGDMWLSVLPVWHSFERTITYIILTFGSGMAYSKPIASVMLPDFEKIRPKWMSGVPRLWESLAKGVIRAMKKAGGVKYGMFKFFISVGGKYAWAKDHVSGRVTHYTPKSRFVDFLVGVIPFVLLLLPHALGEALVYKKVREKLGGQLICAISGGGALPKEIDDFYRAIGLTLLEGYGITEAGPVLSVRNQYKPRPGCVGEVFPSAEIKIVAEKDGLPVNGDPLPPGQKGLIFARGDQIMKGYYKNPELTATVVDKDGWLNTGDLGMLSVDYEIKITGRAKDTIVLVGGENIEPLAVESGINASDFIDASVVLGQDQKYLGALIVVNKDNSLAWAKENHMENETLESLIKTDEFNELIKHEIENRINSSQGFRPCERIYRFEILTEPFTVGKELSAKQEMIRPKINEIYKDKIDSLFD